jgi:hypothetical protein
MPTPHDRLAPQARSARDVRGVLLLIAGLAVTALAVHGPIGQWADYHAFADTRRWLGISNAVNVLSNLPFAFVGAWGLWHLGRAAGPAADTARLAWCAFAVALMATALGSAGYHLAPQNDSLAGDRAPIAMACAALLCGFLAERVDRRCASPATLLVAGLGAAASVAWWWAGERQGHGDLRAYLLVQFLPMLVVPVTLWLQRAPLSPVVVTDRTWWTVLGLYGAAKLMEFADRRVFDALGLLSGHTLKHLLAAAAALCLLHGAVQARRVRRGREPAAAAGGAARSGRAPAGTAGGAPRSRTQLR